MIKNFPNETAYEAAVKPTIESQVAMIENTKTVKYDGVNVIADVPQVGDAVFLDENNKPVIISAPTLIKANVPAAWTYVGEVLQAVDNNHVLLLYKDASQSRKSLDISQYAWTNVVLDGEEHEKTIGLRFGIPDWNTNTDITFTYTATTLAEVAAACTAAIEAKLTELGAPQTTIDQWWAYDDVDNNRVIVQRDACTDYRFYNCSGLTHISWGDMPENSNNGFRINDIAGNERIMNVARGAAYYGTSGRTPTADVPLNDAAGIVKRSDFNNSAYCASLRQAYGTYENYIASEYLVKLPQKLGAFALPDGQAMGERYGGKMVPTKSGSTKAAYPAQNWAYTLSLNAQGMMQGDWHLHGVAEGCMLLRDENLARINKTRQKMGVAQVSSSTARWLAARYNVNGAWFFYGNNGILYNVIVNGAYQVGAVTLLKIK